MSVFRDEKVSEHATAGEFLRPLLEPGAPDGMDGTDEATASVRQRGTAVPVSTGPGSESGVLS